MDESHSNGHDDDDDDEPVDFVGLRDHSGGESNGNVLVAILRGSRRIGVGRAVGGVAAVGGDGSVGDGGAKGRVGAGRRSRSHVLANEIPDMLTKDRDLLTMNCLGGREVLDLLRVRLDLSLEVLGTTVHVAESLVEVLVLRAIAAVDVDSDRLGELLHFLVVLLLLIIFVILVVVGEELGGFDGILGIVHDAIGARHRLGGVTTDKEKNRHGMC